MKQGTVNQRETHLPLHLGLRYIELVLAKEQIFREAYKAKLTIHIVSGHSEVRPMPSFATFTQ